MAKCALTVVVLCTVVANVHGDLTTTSQVSLYDNTKVITTMGSKMLVCLGSSWNYLKCHVRDGSTNGTEVELPIQSNKFSNGGKADIAALDATKAIICGGASSSTYMLYGVSSYAVIACVGLEVSGTDITVGTLNEFHVNYVPWASTPRYHRVSRISADAAIVCAPSEHNMYCGTVTVTGQYLSNGTFVEVGLASDNSAFGLAGLSSTSAIVCYTGGWSQSTSDVLRQLCCTHLTIDLAAETVVAGAQTLMRADTVTTAGTGEGQGPQSTQGEVAAARLSDTAMILCYKMVVDDSIIASQYSYAKTMCGWVSASPLQLGPNYEIGGYSYDLQLTKLPETTTTVVCGKWCDDSRNSNGGCLRGTVGGYDTCRDIQLTSNGDACSIGAAWESTRADYTENQYHRDTSVSYVDHSTVMACTGGSAGKYGCDTLSVDTTRTSCTVFCEPVLGGCVTPAPTQAPTTAAPTTTGAPTTAGPTTVAETTTTTTQVYTVLTGQMSLTVSDTSSFMADAAAKAAVNEALAELLSVPVDYIETSFTEVAPPSNSGGGEGGECAEGCRRLQASGSIKVDYTITVPPSSTIDGSSVQSTIASTSTAALSTSVQREVNTARPNVYTVSVASKSAVTSQTHTVTHQPTGTPLGNPVSAAANLRRVFGPLAVALASLFVIVNA